MALFSCLIEVTSHTALGHCNMSIAVAGIGRGPAASGFRRNSLSHLGSERGLCGPGWSGSLTHEHAAYTLHTEHNTKHNENSLWQSRRNPHRGCCPGPGPAVSAAAGTPRARTAGPPAGGPVCLRGRAAQIGFTTVLLESPESR